MSGLFLDWITIADLGCWGVCFWWMHRISKRQDAVLSELQEQARRIERVSKEEHEILTELRPCVQKIEKDLDEVSDKVTEAESV